MVAMIEFREEILHKAIGAVILLQHRIGQMAAIHVRFGNNQTGFITAA
jgi:hypothetical protein